MNDYILLMHDDATDRAAADDGAAWGAYLGRLRADDRFEGGSSIGSGLRCRKGTPASEAVSPLNGFIRVRAGSLEEALSFLEGNPVHEAGGTVEVRELPRD